MSMSDDVWWPPRDAEVSNAGWGGNTKDDVITSEAPGWYGPKLLFPVKSVVWDVLTVEDPVDLSVSNLEDGAIDDTADCKSDMASSFRVDQNMLLSI